MKNFNGVHFFTAIGFGVAFLEGIKYINESLEILAKQEQHIAIRILAAITIVAILGFLLFRFRQKQRFYYGLAECAFSIAGSWHFASSGKPAEESTTLLALFGFIYIFVRGLDNIDQAKTAKLSKSA